MPGSPPITELGTVITEVFGGALERAGFVLGSHRRWVRTRVPSTRDIFELQAMKGAILTPRWGFSLEFAPHVTGSHVRWHRTAKSAIFDFIDDPSDTMTDDEISR